METVVLGRTGLRASVAGLGCGGHSRLGMGSGHDEVHAARLVAHALDLGINFIDTARAYRTESAVGRALRGKRDTVIISSKFIPGTRDRPLSAADLRESLEKSLARLNTDYIDIFHLHGVPLDLYDHCVQILVPELQSQQQAGKIRFLGITEAFVRDTSHAMLDRALDDDLFDVVMVGFNLLNPSARRVVFPRTRSRNVGTLIMFAVRRALSQPEALLELVERLVQKEQVDASRIDQKAPLAFLDSHPQVRSVVDAAYRFCRHEPGANVILTGTGDPDHLTANVASISGPPLPDELLDRLRDLFADVDSQSGE